MSAPDTHDLTRKLAPFRDGLTYPEVQQLLRQCLAAAGRWQAHQHERRTPATAELIAYLDAVLATGVALRLDGGSEAQIALTTQLAKLTRIRPALARSTASPATGDEEPDAMFFGEVDWPDLFSALSAAFELIPRILFEEATGTAG